MLDTNSSMLVIIDAQEKLLNMLSVKKVNAIKNFEKITKAAKILNVETLITEQYPRGLGETIPNITNILNKTLCRYEKTSFSTTDEKSIFDKILKSEKKQIVLAGIEAHICVYQTALSLQENGYEVYVLDDCIFSRDEYQKEIAVQNLKNRGVNIITIEMALFMWLKNSKNPKFKEVQALIK